MNSWAHSKMVLHIHGMDVARVRFPVGPQKHNILRKQDVVLLWKAEVYRAEHCEIPSLGREILRATVRKIFVTANFVLISD